MSTLLRLVDDTYTVDADTIDEAGHVCGEDCIPCDRRDCTHPSCQHEGGNNDPDGECESHGCGCTRFLAYGDCSTCDGHGSVTVDQEQPSGRVIDCEARCWDCGGTGRAFGGAA